MVLTPPKKTRIRPRCNPGGMPVEDLTGDSLTAPYPGTSEKTRCCMGDPTVMFEPASQPPRL